MKVDDLKKTLKLPVIAAPLFIISNPELVLAQCKAGIVGSFPALNARGEGELERWLDKIDSGISDFKSKESFDKSTSKIPPFAVNQIVHSSNKRLEKDLKICVKKQVPIMITSLRPPDEVVSAAHSYGGLVFHDIVNIRHAEKAIKANVDGLILVAGGAGGHAGKINPMVLVSEVKRIFDGPVVLAGAITKGEHILSAQAMGADYAYMGTRFIASKESIASYKYKEMILESHAKDVIYTDMFTGIPGNYLRNSVINAGFDPINKPFTNKIKLACLFMMEKFSKKLNFAKFDKKGAKIWKDIWSAGQGVGSIDSVDSVKSIVEKLEKEYFHALINLQKNAYLAERNDLE